MNLNHLFRIIWITNILYITALRSCNIALSSKTRLVDLETNVTLTCRVCTISSGISFIYNNSVVGQYAFELGVKDTSLYHAEIVIFTNGSAEINLTIFKFTRSSAGTYTCSIPNSAYMSSWNLTYTVPVEYITLTPALQTISVLPNVMISYIRCISSMGRPAPTITWYIDNKTPSDYTDDVDLTGNSSSVTVADVTTSYLTITPTTYYHRANFYCNVSNGNGSISSSKLLINVLNAPAVQRLQNQSVLLNTSLTVTCPLTDVGNPPASTFTWIRKDTSTVVGTGQTLTINNIGLSDEGVYQCNASNRMQPIGNEVVHGISQSTFYINVEYGAFIRAFRANESNTTIIVDQGDTLELVCDADGDPQPDVSIVNATSGSETSLVQTEAQKAKTRINQARCEYDAGIYKCLAKNRYNKEQHKKLLALFIKCSPRASPFSPPMTELYRAPNDSAEFTFTVKAYPEPKSSDFTWYRRVDDEWKIVSIDSNIFLINISDDKLQTQLVIFTVQVEDYTEYMVNVTNTLGSTAEVFTLHAQSKPYVPKDLLIDRVGQTDIVITWVPGFNGGHDQNFTIRYREADIESWSYIYVASSVINHTWSIEGLKPGKTYQIKMLAENKIGKSDWTQEITETTIVDAVTVDNGSAAPAIGGAIGAAAGVGIIVVVIVVIWIYRTRALQQSDAKQIPKRRSMNHVGGTYQNIDQKAALQYEIPGQYDDLVMETQTRNASNTDGSYSTYILATRRGNNYETLEELEVREYATLNSGDTRRAIKTSSDIQSEMSGQVVSANDDREYVNMKLSAL